MSDIREGTSRLETAGAKLRSAVNEAHAGWRDERFNRFTAGHVAELERVTASTIAQMSRLAEVLQQAQQSLP